MAFGEPQNGICYYSRRHLSPYGDITVTNVKIDTVTSKARVFAEAGIPNLSSTRQSGGLGLPLHLQLARMVERFYRLESIAAQ